MLDSGTNSTPLCPLGDGYWRSTTHTHQRTTHMSNVCGFLFHSTVALGQSPCQHILTECTPQKIEGKQPLVGTATAYSHYTSHSRTTVRFRTVLISDRCQAKEATQQFGILPPRLTRADSEAQVAPLKKFFFEHSKMWGALPSQISHAPSAKWLGIAKKQAWQR